MTNVTNKLQFNKANFKKMKHKYEPPHTFKFGGTSGFLLLGFVQSWTTWGSLLTPSGWLRQRAPNGKCSSLLCFSSTCLSFLGVKPRKLCHFGNVTFEWLKFILVCKM